MTVGYSDNKFTGYPVVPGPLIGLSKNDDEVRSCFSGRWRPTKALLVTVTTAITELNIVYFYCLKFSYLACNPYCM